MSDGRGAAGVRSGHGEHVVGRGRQSGLGRSPAGGRGCPEWRGARLAPRHALNSCAPGSRDREATRMTDLDDLDRLRADYLLALYSAAGPSSMNMPRNSAVAQEVGIEASTGTEIALWLKQRGFIHKMTMGDHGMTSLNTKLISRLSRLRSGHRARSARSSRPRSSGSVCSQCSSARELRLALSPTRSAEPPRALSRCALARHDDRALSRSSSTARPGTQGANPVREKYQETQ